MKYELYTRVALPTELPAQRLRRGDVVTVGESQIEPLNSGEILSVRPLSSAAA